jgi:hypothetical protein
VGYVSARNALSASETYVLEFIAAAWVLCELPRLRLIEAFVYLICDPHYLAHCLAKLTSFVCLGDPLA